MRENRLQNNTRSYKIEIGPPCSWQGFRCWYHANLWWLKRCGNFHQNRAVDGVDGSKSTQHKCGIQNRPSREEMGLFSNPKSLDQTKSHHCNFKTSPRQDLFTVHLPISLFFRHKISPVKTKETWTRTMFCSWSKSLTCGALWGTHVQISLQFPELCLL